MMILFKKSKSYKSEWKIKSKNKETQIGLIKIIIMLNMAKNCTPKVHPSFKASLLIGILKK